VYLLDDPLSAVDANVGKDLFFGCIVDYLKTRRNKAVVLVTHQVQHMQHADRIIVLNKDGNQEFCGSYRELEARLSVGEFGYITSSSTTPGEEESEDDTAPSYEEAKTAAVSACVPRRRRARSSSVDSNLSAGKGVGSDAEGEEEGDSSTAISTTDQDPKHVIIQDEDRIKGKVTFQTYMAYLRSGGALSGVLAFVYAIFGQLLSMLADYWLRWWASGTFGGSQHAPLYVGGFAVLVFCTVVVGYHKAHVWLRYALHASSNLHTRCLWAVLHSPIQFFIANPTGRILNRFAKDQNQVDEMFPSTFFDFVQCTLFCFSAIILVCASMPWLVLLMPPLWYAFLHFRSIYVTSSREIKRIEALTRSPIYADFSAALEGLHTLRAYGLQKRITSSFRQQLDANMRVWNAYLMISRWIGFRLDFLCTFILIAMAFLCALLKGSVDVGLVGFALGK
jgi:ABC-type multidrug transport system fused ATPase/permease subunit